MNVEMIIFLYLMACALIAFGYKLKKTVEKIEKQQSNQH